MGWQGVERIAQDGMAVVALGHLAYSMQVVRARHARSTQPAPPQAAKNAYNILIYMVCYYSDTGLERQNDRRQVTKRVVGETLLVAQITPGPEY
jgi:hypothetical protein